MMKKFKWLRRAAPGLVVFCACGSTTPVSLESPNIWFGKADASSQVYTGGYWWTYSDHAAYDNTHGAAQYEQGATIYPQTNLTTPFVLEVDDQAPERGQIARARGSVPPAPNWSAVINEALYPDLYWQSLFADSLLQDYPLAGVGFGYRANNAPYDIVQGKYVGFVFDMKTESGTNDVAVAVPTAFTDLPDRNNNDAWVKRCTYPSQQPGKTPAESYQNTSASQTCFADFQKVFYMVPDSGGFPGDVRAADGVWQTYCVLWSELAWPSWVKPGVDLPSTMTAEMLAQTLKTKWDFFQPANGGTSTTFDIRLDNVRLVSAHDALAGSACNPANVAPSAAIAKVPAK